MAIIAYPLNGIQYSAEDAQTYFCTRTSGVYSAENHFSLGEVTADRRITIGAGLAWMKISEFGGISFAVTEPVTVSVEGADANTDRTDLIVLRYDGNSQRQEVVCKKNSNSVQQSDGIFELALYRIVIPAGSTQIIASQIEDVRATPLCGIMKDGVTGIPVDNLVEEFRSNVTNTIEEIENVANDKLANITASSNVLLSNFATQSQKALSDANAAIIELNTTEQDFNNAVENANNEIQTFKDSTVPTALENFNADAEKEIDAFLTQASNALNAFGDTAAEKFVEFSNNGDAEITDFTERANRALENFDDTIEDIAGGADVMLQTAFNQSGKVGQVAFADELGIVVTGGFARKLYTGQENVFTVPFTTVQQKEALLENIRNNRPITIRLFSARQTGESTSMDEWTAVVDFVRGNGGTHASVFDWSAPCFDFRFQYADNVNGTSASRAYFTCVFDNFKTAVLSITLSGFGAGGTLTFI